MTGGVRLVLPAGRLWPWHAALAARLAQLGPVELRLASAPPYPTILRAWLALERGSFSGKGVAPLAAARLPDLRPLDGREPAAPLCIDLAGGGGQLSLRYDGRAEEAALWRALFARRPPRLEVVDGAGEVRAASLAALEVPGELGRALGQVHARLLSLVLRAVEGDAASPAVPPAPSAPPRSGSLLGFAAGAIGERARRRLPGGARGDTWRIALRPAPEHEGDAPPAPGGFRVEAGPPDGFHADPFLFAHGGETHLFVERYPWATATGVIAHARLDAAGRPGAFRTVLEAPHHLSYPQVFAHGGEVFMMPETAGARRLEIYRADPFPDRWTLHATALEGLRIADPTLLQHEGRWWVFASVAGEGGGSSLDEVFAWHSASPFGPWTAHPANPLVSDARAGRPGGRFLRRGGRLYRPAQDGSGGYGSGLAWMEVVELTPERYAERPAGRWSGGDFGRFTGVHTFSEAGGWQAIDLKSPR